MTGPSAVSLRIAVIGAGIAGLACARELARLGASVTVFDEGKAPGGRAATLITPHGNFDHGAQYFTIVNSRFSSAVTQWTMQGLVRLWDGRVIAYAEGRVFDQAMNTERHVPVPGMSELGRQLATGLDVCLNTRIECVDRRTGLWQLYSADGRALSVRGFDALAVAIPSTPALRLLKGHTELTDAAAGVQWLPCWSAALALSQPCGAQFDAAFINDDPILGWVSRDSAKPGRAPVTGVAERWVLHAKPRWSVDYADLDTEQAGQWLMRALSARLGRPLKARGLSAYRWSYATVVNPLSQQCLWDSKRRVGMAGDWCGGPRIEDAYLSGLALADTISRQLW